MNNSKYILNNGMEVPIIGFGVVNRELGQDFIGLLNNAFEAGYRYFDTASLYGTERELGQVIKSCGIARNELTIATKVWYEEMGYQGTKDAVERSLDRLGLDYLDIYIVHWPKKSIDDPNWKSTLLETWQAMEEYKNKGLIKALGVSNFLPHHMEVLLQNSAVKPVVDQLELHLGYIQEYTLNYLQKNNILPQAWSPMGRNKEVFTQSEAIKKMAEKYGVNNQRLSLRYLLQRGIMPIAASSKRNHMESNLHLHDFEISDEDMSVLSCMPQTGWLGEHPDFCMPVGKHVDPNQ